MRIPPDPPRQPAHTMLPEARALLTPEGLPREVTNRELVEVLAAVRERADEYLSKQNHVVYFARLGNRIKIGTTKQVAKRMSQLSIEELLAVQPGGRDLESALHRRFWQYHVVGEWFSQGPLLLAYIDTIKVDDEL